MDQDDVDHVAREFFHKHRFNIERVVRDFDALNKELEERIKRMDRTEWFSIQVTLLMPILFFSAYAAGGRLVDLIAACAWTVVALVRPVMKFLAWRKRRRPSK